MGCPADLVESHLDVHLSVVGQSRHGDAGVLHGAQRRTDLAELEGRLGRQPLREGRLQLQEAAPGLLGSAKSGLPTHLLNECQGGQIIHPNITCSGRRACGS